jgi:hypothetical protein
MTKWIKAAVSFWRQISKTFLFAQRCPLKSPDTEKRQFFDLLLYASFERSGNQSYSHCSTSPLS